MEKVGNILGINASIIKVKTKKSVVMGETVMVGNLRLVGEVIRINSKFVVVQVFEDTVGLKRDEPVYGSGTPLSLSLAPGIIGNIFDGIERPLKEIKERSGIFISRGVHVESLDINKKWETNILVNVNEEVEQGTIIAEVKETSIITHKVMVPANIYGTVIYIAKNGDYTINDTLVKLKLEDESLLEIKMVQKWPIRVPRLVKTRYPINKPLITGQRIIDTFFPIGKGGAAALPGGFGTGKTMTQHQLAKWSDADIIVYIGCGERGNEMTQVLEDFSKLKDPKTNNPLMDRTVLIANTSNMPVAAREASIYTGITIAEYYRDMGYHVAVMADSTSRWAEALRELSGRLEEMPAEEGFPPYLASRLAGFYERAGYVKNFNNTEGSVTIIGAVSPQGGDFSEPVTQNTKRFVRSFWTLDRNLAYSRHFPAIQWLTSYSEYVNDLEDWYKENVDKDFMIYRDKVIKILNEENELMEIAKLIGSDVLPDSQRIILEIAKVIRLGFIQQNAYHKFDTYVPLRKQFKMMKIILYLYEKCKLLIDMNIPINTLKEYSIFDDVVSIKYDTNNTQLEMLDIYIQKIDIFYNKVYEYSV